jgi:hypothetical protein
MTDWPCKTTINQKNLYKPETETSMYAYVPPERRSISVPLPPKKFSFYSADFCFRFHIFIMFLFFDRKVGKFPLHFHPYSWVIICLT